MPAVEPRDNIFKVMHFGYMHSKKNFCGKKLKCFIHSLGLKFPSVQNIQCLAQMFSYIYNIEVR